MSFQTILNIHQSLSINNRRMIGQQVSRSGQIRIAQYLTAVPWVFTVKPHEYLYYPQVRNVIQSIDNADRQVPEYLSFDTPQLEWFVMYQGGFSALQLTALNTNAVPAPNSQVIQIKGLPTVGSTIYAFKAGDFIQIQQYVYKVTADVLRGSSSFVEVPLHRPIIGAPPISTPVLTGKNVQFRMVAEKCPTYTLNPMTDGAFVQWDGDFVFREYIIG
jgi:hypothetical protein